MTFLVKEKSIYRTDFPRTVIYQNETNAEDAVYYFSEENFDLTDRRVVIWFYLPDTTVKYKLIEEFELSDNGLYKASIPMVSALTELAGEVKTWVTFTTVGASSIMQTNMSSFTIRSSLIKDLFGEVLDQDTALEKVEVLEKKVAALEDEKADDIRFNPETNMLSLISNDEVIASTEIPEEVTWEDWES